MPESREIMDAAAQGIRDSVARLPVGTASLTEKKARFTRLFRIVPEVSNACTVEFHIAEDGTFGLYLGAIRAENLPLSAACVVEMCEAVGRGDIDEESWSRKGTLLKYTTVLHLPSGDLSETEVVEVFGLVGATEHARKRYEPYV